MGVWKQGGAYAEFGFSLKQLAWPLSFFEGVRNIFDPFHVKVESGHLNRIRDVRENVDVL